METMTDDISRKKKKNKRAPKACLACRSRKVRCDVWHRGVPCTNCSLDGTGCAITSKRPRRVDGTIYDKTVKPRHEKVLKFMPIISGGQSKHEVKNGTSPSAPSLDHIPKPVPQAIQNNYKPEPEEEGQREGEHVFEAFTPVEETSPALSEAASQTACKSHSTVIYYSYYPFLGANNLSNCLSQDVAFLDSQKCLHVPTRDILRHFLDQYFLHVHPTLPLINEGEFWKIYSSSDSSAPTFSLLVFQAVMFASCNFVPLEVLRSMGYDSIRNARAALYRKAKLLYDFGIESSPVAISQAALHLTYWTPPASIDTKPNTTWLSIAIQNAKTARADHYSSSQLAPDAKPLSKKRHNVLKRLWWCCIMRDRIIALGLRRSIQISRDAFECAKPASLELADLGDEEGSCLVYSAETKKELMSVVVRLAELCVILTDVLTLAFTLLVGAPGGPERPDFEMEKIRECKDVLLRRWFEVTSSDAICQDPSSPRHPSITLYTTLMLIYYQTARVVLCHRELQLLTLNNSGALDESRIRESRNELSHAAGRINQYLESLNKLQLTKYLPITAVAYTVFPLTLQVLDWHLSSPPGASPDYGKAVGSEGPGSKPSNLIQAMRTFYPQYDGVDWVAKIIRCAVQVVQQSSTAADSSIADWTQLLTVSPSEYLRLSVAVDISLNSGKVLGTSEVNEYLDDQPAVGLVTHRGTSDNPPTESVSPSPSPPVPDQDMASLESDLTTSTGPSHVPIPPQESWTAIPRMDTMDVSMRLPWEETIPMADFSVFFDGSSDTTLTDEAMGDYSHITPTSMPSYSLDEFYNTAILMEDDLWQETQHGSPVESVKNMGITMSEQLC